MNSAPIVAKPLGAIYQFFDGLLARRDDELKALPLAARRAQNDRLRGKRQQNDRFASRSALCVEATGFNLPIGAARRWQRQLT